MEKNQTSQFLGTENISKLILKFSVPCVLALLVSALYNIVDQIFIGNSELSTLGNAATGVVFPVFIISHACSWCVGDGCAAHLNICQGKNNAQNAHKAIGTGLSLILAASLLLMLVFYPLKRPLLTLFGASENSLAYAVEYLDWILAFFPVYMLTNAFIPVIRADGNPTWAMLATLVGAVVNIILDPVFIFVCKWGMSGAAIATVIGQTVSFLFAFAYLFRSKTFKLTFKSFLPDFKEFKSALQLGASSFITQITVVVIALTCNILLAKYGAQSKYGADIPIAVIAVQSKVFTVVINLVVGIVLGCQPIISYNIGARKYDRVKELYRKILLCTLVIGILSTLLFELAPRAVLGLFGAPTNIPNPEDYWEFGEKTFRIFLMFITFTCFVKMASIFFQAAGKPIRAVIASMIRDIVCFVPLAIILPRSFGVEGILYAAPAADLVAMAIALTLTVGFLKTLKTGVNGTISREAIQPSKEGVIVTIARKHGTLGRDIGKLVADKLGVPFYDKETAALAAKESGLDKEFISELDEDETGRFKRLYLSTEVARQAVIAQDQIIRKIAQNGSCVIVGRAADFVLRDNKNLVSVFLTAPEEYRVRKIMEVYGDDEANAKKHLRRSDEARSAYYHTVSGQAWGDSGNYRLCLDASIGVEQSANIILAYLENWKNN